MNRLTSRRSILIGLSVLAILAAVYVASTRPHAVPPPPASNPLTSFQEGSVRLQHAARKLNSSLDRIHQVIVAIPQEEERP